MRSAREPGSTPRRWSAQVALRPPALDLDAGVFTWSDPEQIAASLLRSAQRSRRRKRSAYASAMAMLCLYINRAGRKLEPLQRQVLEAAKQRLREQALRAKAAAPAAAESHPASAPGSYTRSQHPDCAANPPAGPASHRAAASE